MAIIAIFAIENNFLCLKKILLKVKNQLNNRLPLQCRTGHNRSFEIVKLNELSGDHCAIYSIRFIGEDDSLFEQFLSEYYTTFRNEVLDIYTRLKAIGRCVGLREGFYKANEGKPGDGVCALYDKPDAHLRVYFIYYGTDLIVVGDGGEKPKNIRTWQEDPVLTDANLLMQWVSEKISEATENKDIQITDKGFEGNLIIEVED